MRSITELPEDLPCFYNNVLTTCSHDLKEQERSALKLLFAWIAFAERPLILEEAYSLLRLKLGKSIDLEMEVTGRCSRYVTSFWEPPWSELIPGHVQHSRLGGAYTRNATEGSGSEGLQR